MKKNDGDTTIRISRETRDVLVKIGMKNQTYEEILQNVICFWIDAHEPTSTGVCMLKCGKCIDPCDDCPIMEAIQLDEKGVPIKETLCKLEQGSEECYKTACPSCQYFWKKN